MSYELKPLNQKQSYTEYTVRVPTTQFAIGFEYTPEDNIYVRLDGEDIVSLGYTYELVNPLQVRVTPAIPRGVVRITRETDIDQNKHVFRAGALFNANSIDENFEQLRHRIQEFWSSDEALYKAIADGDAELKAYIDMLASLWSGGEIEGGVPSKWVNTQIDGDLTQEQLNAVTVHTVESVVDLLAIDLWHGRAVRTRGYWAGSTIGGQLYIYDADMPRANHNGGSIIDPTKVWDGSREEWAYVAGYFDCGVGESGVDDPAKVTAEVQAAILAAGGNLTPNDPENPTNFRTSCITLGGFIGASSSDGTGCWVVQRPSLSFTMFGAVGDGQADDSYAMLACVRATPADMGIIELEPLIYLHGNGDIRNIVLHFSDKQHLIIKGNFAEIRSNANNLATVTSAIMRFDNCSHTRVEALHIDGQLSERMVVGKDWSTNNDQHNIHIGHNCNNMVFSQCASNSAMMDGFFIQGSGAHGYEVNTILFEGCSAVYCYRQGASIIQGWNIQFVGGLYGYTGRLSNGDDGTKTTAPSSGIDVEANSDGTNNRVQVAFTGVTFEGNLGKGLVLSKNSYCTVDKCVFIANPYIGIQVEQNAINARITNCKFTGSGNFDIYYEAGSDCVIQDNTFQDSNYGATAITTLITAGTRNESKCIIRNNHFEGTSTGLLRNALSLDYSGVIVDGNTFINSNPIWVGGAIAVTNNRFISSATVFINTWVGGSITTCTGNEITHTSGAPVSLMSYPVDNVYNLSANKINGDYVERVVINGRAYRSGAIQITAAPTLAPKASEIRTYSIAGLGLSMVCGANYTVPSGSVTLSAAVTDNDTLSVIFTNNHPTNTESLPSGYVMWTAS